MPDGELHPTNGKALPEHIEVLSAAEEEHFQRLMRWEDRHAAIQRTYLELFKGTGVVPTMRQVAQSSGISLSTIVRHYKDMKIEDITGYHKVRADRILFALASAAEKGNERAAKLYFQLVFGYREEIGVRMSGTMRHLHSVDWKKLPTEALKRIRAGESVEKVLQEYQSE